MNTFDGGLVDLDFKIAIGVKNLIKFCSGIVEAQCTNHISKLPYMANIGCVIQKMP